MDPILILIIGMAVVLGGILVLRLHAFLALIVGAVLVASLTPTQTLQDFGGEKLAAKSVGSRIADKFGETAGKVGILIAMAAVIGKCLMQSGAADKIVRASLRLVGEKRAPLAFMGSSFLLAIPVYFDTVFYLMIPLGKAAALRDVKRYGLLVLAIVAGGTMAHSLVPPTPGPLLVASELKVDIGKMIVGGIVLGLFTSASGFAFAYWANKRWPIPLRDSAEAPLDELDRQSKLDETSLPPLWLSLMPVLLPVVLIAGATFLNSPGLKDSASLDGFRGLFGFIGDKNVALTLAAAVAMVTVIRQKVSTLQDLGKSLQGALSSGGLIILITSAGGAFGGVLQQCGIGDRIEQLAPTANALWLLPMAFLVTAIVRAAQGSATVAMITAVGMLANFGDASQLGFDPLYLALAIGCGSKPFAWMNDSGFWVISKMSGMTEAETLRSFSGLLTVMGFVGLAVTMIAAAILPHPFGH